MAIIQDAITSLMGGGGSEDWLSQLRPARSGACLLLW